MKLHELFVIVAFHRTCDLDGNDHEFGRPTSSILSIETQSTTYLVFSLYEAVSQVELVGLVSNGSFLVVHST